MQTLLDLPKRDLRGAVVVMGTSMASPKGFACTVPLLFWLFKSAHYASPTASFNTITTPSRGSQREGLSVTANRAASLAALSLCLQAISRCVSAPLNSSRGKSIKAGVREENPIKRRAWFPQHERSPRGFIQQSERHKGGLQTYINCITGFCLHNVYHHMHYLPWILQRQLKHFPLYLNGALSDAIKFE